MLFALKKNQKMALEGILDVFKRKKKPEEFQMKLPLPGFIYLTLLLRSLLSSLVNKPS